MPAKTKVEFALVAPQAQSVAVAGTFNDWDAQRSLLKKDQDGTWRAKFALAAGRYEYRFIVDGAWLNDPFAAEDVPNPHGGTNSVRVV